MEGCQRDEQRLSIMMRITLRIETALILKQTKILYSINNDTLLMSTLNLLIPAR